MYFSFSNFKPYSLEQPIQIRPITLLYGPNSQGKSSINQALTLFSQSFLSKKFSSFGVSNDIEGSNQFDSDTEGSNELDSEEIFELLLNSSEHNFGEYSDICHKGNTSEPIIFEIETDHLSRWNWSLAKAMRFNLEGKKTRVYRKRVTYEFRPKSVDPETGIPLHGTTGILSRLSYRFEFLDSLQSVTDIDGFSFIRDPKNNRWTMDRANLGDFEFFCQRSRDIIAYYGYTNIPSKEQIQYVIQNSQGLNFYLEDRSIFVKYPIQKGSSSQRNLSPVYSVTRFLSHLLDNSDIKLAMTNIKRISGTREAPQRIYQSSDSMASALKVLMQPGDENTTRRDRFNEKLKKLHIHYAIPPWDKCRQLEGYYLFKLEILEQGKPSGRYVSLVDVGVGVSQVLPILCEIELMADNQTKSKRRIPNLLMIEQPELHLHPRLQTELADSFIDNKGAGSFLIETHSEEILQRILRRIREGKLKPQDVSLLYVKQDKNGVSNIEEVEISENGNFCAPWPDPDGFFSESYRESITGKPQ